MRLILTLATIALVTATAPTLSGAANKINVATFNVESDGDTQPAKVAETIDGINGVDVWALQEVESGAAVSIFLAKAGAGKWRSVISESGVVNNRKHDHLAILYRTDLFRLIETVEYHAIRSKPDTNRPVLGRPSPGLRGLLLLGLQHKKSGERFYVGNAHLKCCGAGKDTRAHQAGLIVTRIAELTAPVILVGDLNIPVAPGSAASDQTSDAFKALNAALTWLAPTNPVRTGCHPGFNSMLDLVFHSPGLSVWNPAAEVQRPDPAYCQLDGAGFSDHRPVVATFTIP